MKFITALFSAFILTACTDTTIGKFTALGEPATVICYSGGKEIYSGRSTGKVLNGTNSDGYEFVDAETHRLIRVSGDCIVRN